MLLLLERKLGEDDMKTLIHMVLCASTDRHARLTPAGAQIVAQTRPSNPSPVYRCTAARGP